MINFVSALKWVLLVTSLTSRINADNRDGIKKGDTNGEPKKIVCYHPNWSANRPGTGKFTPQNINPNLCTHLIYAFGGLDNENGLQPSNKKLDIEMGGYAQFNGLKTQNKNLKTLLVIGGYNEGPSRFSKIAADENRRVAFAKNVIRYLRLYNFDGVDLDWEYPAFRDGSQPEDKDNYPLLLKTLLVIGGYTEGPSKFSKIAADENRRAAFAKNVIRYLRQYNFDGVDLDWEFPAFRDGSQPEDKDNYPLLLKALREEFENESSKTGKSRLLLTMTAPNGIEFIDKGYDVPNLSRYLDFFNVLCYDYHAGYEPNANHHAPLYSLQKESGNNVNTNKTVDHTINYYLMKGADPKKLVLGIPTYGRSFTLSNPNNTEIGSPADGPGEKGETTQENGYLAYYEICERVKNNNWKVIQPKKGSLGPYAFHENQWVSYDDADMVKAKAKYVNGKGLGGIMFWTIGYDDFRGECHGIPFPLIEAGKEALSRHKRLLHGDDMTHKPVIPDPGRGNPKIPTYE